MTRYRTADEIRRYDLMKLGVLLLLILLLFLTWYATREDGALDLTEAAESTAVAEATADGLDREPGDLVVPTLAPPAIDVPAGSLPPGAVTLSGRAGPGAQVALLADGRPLGMASAGVDGTWALTVDLPAGQYSLTAQTLDNVGTVVAESTPLTITVGDEPTAAPEAGAGGTQARFDPLGDRWSLGGQAAPNAVVVILLNGTPQAQTTADATGAWTLDVPGSALAGDVVIQSTDAGGTSVAEPVTLGPRPPAITAPGGISTAASGDSFLAVPLGAITWSGRGAPGTQVEVIVDEQNAGVARVDESGNWTLPLDLTPGQHSLQFNSLDAAGALLAAGEALVVAAGEEAAAALAAQPSATQPPAEATAAEPEATPEPGVTPEPSPAGTIAATLESRPEFSTLLRAIEVAGLGEPLAGPGPFTVFAPTNGAFTALPQSVVDALLANPEVLATVLRYHVAQGRYTAADLRVVQPSTIDNRLLTVGSDGDFLTVNGAVVVTADIAAGNGIIHAIDRILLPPLATSVRPPIIDDSGVATFIGPRLTVVGTAEPGRTILVELNGQAFGEAVIVAPDGTWQVSGDVAAADYRIVAFMLNGATLEAFSRPVNLAVR